MRSALYVLVMLLFLGIVEGHDRGDTSVAGPSGSARGDETEELNLEAPTRAAGESSDQSTVLPEVGAGGSGDSVTGGLRAGVSGEVPEVQTEVQPGVVPGGAPSVVPQPEPGAGAGPAGSGGGGGGAGGGAGISKNALRPSSYANEQLKANPEDLTVQSGTSEIEAQRLSADHSNPHNGNGKGTGGATSQSSNSQSQSQAHTEIEGDPRGTNKSGGSTGRIESTGPQVGQIPLGDGSDNNRNTLHGKKSTGKPSSMLSTTAPLSEVQKSIQNSKTDTNPKSSKEVSESTDKTIPGTLPTGVSPPKAAKDDTKKPSDELQTNDKRPNAQLRTDPSQPTTTETHVATSKDDLARPGTPAATTTTTVTPPGPGNNVDTKTPLSTVSNALPLLNSVDKTDGILGSTSLFALAALATLAVAAAAPAH